MTAHEAIEICERILYKDCRIMCLLRPDVDGVDVSISRNIPDRDDRSPTVFRQVEFIEGRQLRDLDQSLFLQIVFSNIKRMEIHEAGEQFYSEGKRIFDPHKE